MQRHFLSHLHISRHIRYAPHTALGLALLATAAFHPLTDGNFWIFGIFLVVVGAFLLTYHPTTPSLKDERIQMPLASISWWHVVLFGVGLLSLALTLIRSTPMYWYNLRSIGVHIQHGLLMGGMLLVVLGAGGFRLRPFRVTYTGIGLVGIALAAFAIRLYDLGGQINYLVEEWLFVEPVATMEAGTPLLYQIGFYATSPRLYVYWQKVLAEAVGGGLFGLRLLSALLGALGVLATGFLAYELFDKRLKMPPPLPISIIAAVLLATLPVHIHYSRLGLFNVMDTVTFTAAAAFLLRAIRLNERLSFAFAGGMIGLTHYFYEVAKVLSTPVLLLWLLIALYYGVRVQRRGLAVLVLTAAVIIAVPWVVDHYTRVNSLARLETSSILFTDEN